MKIKIGCSSLDELLNGGVESSCLTLLFGEAGSGKTNVCLQIARNAVRGGKKVVFIDTEGVSLERLRQMCGDDFEKVLQGILFSEPYSFDEQEKFVEKAAKLAEDNPEIGLLILDSATTHFRLTKKDQEKEGRQSLTRQITKLMRAARKEDIPVLLTSQVYTDIDRGTHEPLGGHMLAHSAKTIVRLDKIGANLRAATLMKHRHLPEGRNSKFRLTERGVEDY